MTAPPGVGIVEPLTLELSLDPADMRALRKNLAGDVGGGLRRARRLEVIWHDTVDGGLADRGMTAALWREGSALAWRLEPLAPTADVAWPPGTPPPLAATAATAAGLDTGLHDFWHPVLRFDGRIRRGMVSPLGVTATLCVGTVRAATDGAVTHGGRDAERGPMGGGSELVWLVLEGPAAAVATLARHLASSLRLTVPTRSLAAQARGMAGLPVPSRALGAPILAQGLAADDAFARVAGHLLGVILHHAPRAAARRRRPNR